MSRSALVEAEIEIQVLRAMLIDTEARVQAAEAAVAAAPPPEVLEAVESKVRGMNGPRAKIQLWRTIAVGNLIGPDLRF